MALKLVVPLYALCAHERKLKNNFKIFLRHCQMSYRPKSAYIEIHWLTILLIKNKVASFTKLGDFSLVGLGFCFVVVVYVESYCLALSGLELYKPS